MTFSLVYSPERVLTEPIFVDLRRYPNIGLTNQFARFTADRGSTAYQVVEASNPQPMAVSAKTSYSGTATARSSPRKTVLVTGQAASP